MTSQCESKRLKSHLLCQNIEPSREHLLPRKKRIVLEKAAFWHEVKVV